MSASIDAYRSINVGTANPRDVIVKLYSTAARSLREAEAALAAGQRADEPLTKVQTIVGGLMSALDFDAGDLSKKLLNLYLFVLDRVQESAASSKDVGLADARSVLETLQAAWEEMPAGAARPKEASLGLNFRG
ncbi:MAG: hypothetical protein DHS20C21_20950 [Gemmatimonadota bacterium]|nr:MAG: hypothetical protein DHS20C21_20950 [Gemmatimonadota bacterium]